MWERLRGYALCYRGYRGFNTLDRISIVAMGLGGVVLLVLFLFDLDGSMGPGGVLLVLGFIVLVRDFPGQAN
jgi:hypothetical protein